MKRIPWVTAAALVAALASAGLAEQEGIHIPPGRKASFMWTLTDNHGFRWDIDGQGNISDGTSDAYDGGMQLRVSGSTFSRVNSGRMNKEGNEVEIGPWRRGGVSISRRIFINKKAGYCRWIDIFENTQKSDATVAVQYYFNMGNSTQRTHTTSGKTALTANDWGIITAGSSSSSSRPAVAHVFATATAAIKPTFQFNSGNDNLFYNISLKVPAGKAVALCFFEAQRRPFEQCVKFLDEFKPHRELRLVPSPLRRIIVNMTGSSLTLGDIELTRNEEADLLILRNGDEMRGTITNPEYALTTEFGAVTIPQADVIGLTGRATDSNKVQLILTNGQIVAGELAGGPIVFRLAGGTELKIPARGIRQASYRVSPVKPEQLDTTDSMVVLRTGTRLAFDEAGMTVAFSTAHGRMTLSPADLRSIELDTPAGGLHRAVFRNGSALAGLLTDEEVALELKLGLTLKVPRQRVLRLHFANADAPRGQLAALTLRNTNLLYGRLTDAKWTLRKKLGDVEVACDDIASVRFLPGSVGQVSLELRDGTKMGGRLAEEYVGFKIEPGPKMRLFVGQIDSFTGSGAPAKPKPSADSTDKAAANDGLPPVDPNMSYKELAKSLAVGKAQLDALQNELAALVEAGARNPNDAGLAERTADVKRRSNEVMSRLAQLQKLYAIPRASQHHPR